MVLRYWHRLDYRCLWVAYRPALQFQIGLPRMSNAVDMMEAADTPKTPGERLRWARENRTDFHSASDAARAYGWPISTYLGHENGDRTPSREAAKSYALVYHVPWHWILEGGPLPSVDITAPPLANAGKLKAIRSRAIGLRELARAIGWEASRYQYYEDSYKKAYLPLELVDLIRPHLVGRGEPPVTETEIDSLLPPPRNPTALARGPDDTRALLAIRAMIEAGASGKMLLAFIDDLLDPAECR